MVKKLFNEIVSLCLGHFHKNKLKKLNGEHFVFPTPPYISQFIGIYPQSIKVDKKLTNKKHIEEFGAKDSDEFSFWSWRNCGIACVKMILNTKGENSPLIMDLTHEGIDLGGYVLYKNGVFVDKGWFHQALVVLIRKYGVKAKMKKWQSIYSVATDILSNKMVVLSVLVPGRSYISLDGKFKLKNGGEMGGHLLLATGVKFNNGRVEGIYAHDPRGLPQYQANTWIPADVFKNIFSGRTIVAE